jgi:hypothetical protein
MYKNTEDPLWLKESKHNLIKVALLLFFIGLSVGLALLWHSIWLIVILVVFLVLLPLRTAYKMRDRVANWRIALWYGVHAHLMHGPMFFGQLAYLWDRLRCEKPRIIDYKARIK